MLSGSREVVPDLSVIIPVYNGGLALKECLRAVYQSEYADFEVIVVDDGSSDRSVETASSFPCRLVQLPLNSGPAKARNEGVAQSRGRILFFLDADIIIRPDTLGQIARSFAEDAGMDALFGSYTKDTVPQNFVSRYKNFLHHFTHQHSSEDAVTFCGGFGAVRREVFQRLGGFDVTRRFLEDIEFGHRLHRQGHRIRLIKSLQMTHCKRYSLASLVKSDLVGRAIPWTRLILETGVVRSDLNLKPNNIASVPLSYLMLTAVISGQPAFGAALVPLFLLLNHRFLLFVGREGGAWFAIQSTILCWFGYLYSGAGALFAAAQYLPPRWVTAISERTSVKT